MCSIRWLNKTRAEIYTYNYCVVTKMMKQSDPMYYIIYTNMIQPLGGVY